MRKLKQFGIKSPLIVKGEYEGNEESGKAIIFSHGFGVRRDSREMFNEIGNVLKDESIVVRFDYVEIDENEDTKVPPLKDQAKMLDVVLNKFKEKFDLREINLICHSMGCIVASLLKPEGIKKAVLLAPPPTRIYDRFMNNYSSREGCVINEDGVTKLKRSDGSFTYIGLEFWKELKEFDPYELISEFSKVTDLTVVRALQDHVLKEDSYDKIKTIEVLEYLEINGNHDFDGNDREGLLSIVKDIFQKI